MTRGTNSLPRKTIPWIVATIILVVGTIASHLLYSTCIIFRDGWTLEVRPLVATATIATLSHITISYYQNNRQLRLFPAIVFWVLLGLTAYTILSAIWSNHEASFSDYLFAGWYSLNTNKLEQVKVTLTAIGGIGGVSFLVIKYRQQDIAEKQYKNDEQERTNAEEIENNRKFEAEKAEANKKLVDAVQQLGHQSPQVRIAGVYALADVADTYGSEKYGVDYDKRVFEILCGYLRTDRLTSSALDYATESTIWDVVSSRTRTPYKSSPGRWSPLDLDIHKTMLVEEVKLGRAHINSIHFQGTTLMSRCSLVGICTAGEADFNGATFSETADFSFAKLGYANFNNARFESYAYFSS